MCKIALDTLRLKSGTRTRGNKEDRECASGQNLKFEKRRVWASPRDMLGPKKEHHGLEACKTIKTTTLGPQVREVQASKNRKGRKLNPLRAARSLSSSSSCHPKMGSPSKLAKAKRKRKWQRGNRETAKRKEEGQCPDKGSKQAQTHPRIGSALPMWLCFEH